MYLTICLRPREKLTLTRSFLAKQFASSRDDVKHEVDIIPRVIDFACYGFGKGAVISPVFQQPKKLENEFVRRIPKTYIKTENTHPHNKEKCST